MKITFKTVQNKLFTIDADEAETVGALKKKIEESQTFPASQQKLIYSGKILKDDATVGDLKIKEKDFLVVMVSKPKAAPASGAATPAAAAAPVAPSTPAPAAAAESTSTPAAAESTETAAAPAATTESAPAEAASEAAPAEHAPLGSSFLTGPQLQSAIESMVEMGFSRDQVSRALRASFNNPDRAVEYLMSGNIPESEPTPAPAPRAPAPAAAPAVPSAPTRAEPAAAPAPSGGSDADNLFAAAEAAMQRDRGLPAGAGAGAGGGGGPSNADYAQLAALANSPQVQQIRDAVQQDPELIQPILQQIAAANPRIAQMFNENPQMLYDLLGVGEGGEGGEDYGGPQVMQVNLTDDEVAAVERLEQLGFDRQSVLQAYLLCEKNEELAANYLFDSAEDDEPMH